MILIAGGTGRLGRELIPRLVHGGHQVRVLTRDTSNATGIDAEVVIGDVRDPATLADAVQGCTTVVSAVHGLLGGRGAGPEEVDDRGNANLIDAAISAGVGQFVLISVLDARADHPMSLHRAKFAAEQHLSARTIASTVLRPAAYLETWTDVIGAKLQDGGPALVFGTGENPINFVSVVEVATIVSRAIDDPGLRGQIIDVPGPEDITMNEFARRLGATKTKRIPRPALRLLSVAARPISPAFARQTHAALIMDTTDMRAARTHHPS